MYYMISLWPVWLLNRQKKALLLNYNHKEAYEVCENLTTGAEDETYEDVISLLDGHFATKKQTIVMTDICFKILNKTLTKRSSNFT